MTPTQVAQIQKSFVMVEEVREATASGFYHRLFEIAPETRPLFPQDMAEQKSKFMSMLGLIVIGLDKLEAILPAARSLASRHVGYGVRAEHYASVGTALLWTLKRELGPAWTDELAASWAAAYRLLSDVMIGEAHGPVARAQPL